MLTGISKYIRPSSPRSMPHWNQHLNNLKSYQKEHIRRFLASPGMETGGVRFLRYILNFVDYDILRKYTDDFQRYSRYISHIEDDVSNIFDPVNKGLSYNNLFISKLQMYPTNEYVFPTYDVDHIKLLPFNKPWEDWAHLKPVTLWTHNSAELCQNLLQDQIQYRYIQPTYAVVFIDVVTLSFMYFKYLETQPDHSDQWASRKFIHEVVIKNLFDDVLNIWLTQQLAKIGECETREDLEALCRTAISSMDNRYGYVGGRFSEASLELFNELQLVKNGNITLSSLFSSNLYPGMSIIDRMNYAETWLEVPDLRQYKFIDLLKDMPYLDIIINFYKHVPNKTDMQRLVRELRVDFRKHIINKTWSSMRNRNIRLHVEEEFDRMYATLMSFDA